jgi:uncharacterized protein (DUF1330 family)
VAVILIAQLWFKDIDKYRTYQKEFPKIFSRYPGRVLVNDEKPVVLEGEWSGDKVVALEFATKEDAAAFSFDPDYMRISEDRKAGANSIVVMVESYS